MLRSISLISLVLLFISPFCLADSLWQQNKPSLYSSTKAVKIGDIITIYIAESTSAAQQAETKTSKEASIGAKYSDIWNQLSEINSANNQSRREGKYQISGDDSYNGGGQTTRKSQVKAVLTAVVTEVQDGGNLFLLGEHKVKINDETETIKISGIVRPEDISPQNSVYSYQMGQLEVELRGKGVVGEKQSPGFLSKMLNWLF